MEYNLKIFQGIKGTFKALISKSVIIASPLYIGQVHFFVRHVLGVLISLRAIVMLMDESLISSYYFENENVC